MRNLDQITLYIIKINTMCTFWLVIWTIATLIILQIIIQMPASVIILGFFPLVSLGINLINIYKRFKLLKTFFESGEISNANWI